MQRDEEWRTAEWLARLVSVSDLKAIPRKQLLELAGDFHRLPLLQGELIPPSATLIQKVAEYSPARLLQESPPLSDEEWTLLSYLPLLEVVHEQARGIILGLLEHGRAEEVVTVKFVFELKDKRVGETLHPVGENPYALAIRRLPPSVKRPAWAAGQGPGHGERPVILGQLLLPLLRLRPFPFGKCGICGKVFVQLRKGKARRYCSESCKAKGVPSAAKRTEYVRTQRQKKRGEEILTARRILRAWPKAEQWQMLQQTFPKKSRRQLLYLLKRAQRKQKEE